MERVLISRMSVIAVIILTLISCKETGSQSEVGTEEPAAMEVEEINNEINETEPATSEKSEFSAIVDNYLTLKDALVNDDEAAAKEAGAALVVSLDKFQIQGYEQAQQEELEDIVVDAREHSEHIAKSDIAHQREHFDILSVDLNDMIAITGTSQKLYQAYCPMYNDNKGAIWLSSTKEIQNPYFGQKMLKCGKVEKEIE